MYTEKIAEHPYKTLAALLKTEDLPSLMLFCGAESYLLDWAENAVKKAVLTPGFEPIDCTVFTDEDADGSSILESCETLAMMSSKKLVIVKEDPAAFPELTDYLPKLPASAILVFVCEKPDKRKAIYKQIEKCGAVYDFCRLDRNTLAGWASKKASFFGKALAPELALSFAESAGYFQKDGSYGLLNLEGDIKKACALEDGPELTQKAFSEISGENLEADSFQLLDCAFQGKKGEAYKLLNNAIKSEQPSRQIGIVLSLAGLLCSQLEIMYEARLRIERGQSQSQIAEESGINSYRLRKAIEASARLSTARLKAALAGAYRIEEDIKGGKLEGRLAMELFIAKL